MSILSGLRPAKGSTHYRKVVGRGRGSGLGGTAGKGHKGQKARKSPHLGRGFEGGQTPLARRLPKFGFTNQKFKTVYSVVNLSQLEALPSKIDETVLREHGLLHTGLVKILARGEVKSAKHVVAHKFSAKAKELIEKAGGKVEEIK